MILVFGSVNVDLVARVARLPSPGETMSAHAFARLPGGKGANQALAARRAGSDVHLHACVGDDAGMAALALDALRRDGVDLAGVRTVAGPTGIALIHVDDHGENCITVVPGANALARAADVPDAKLAAGTTLVMQLEVPRGEIAALAQRARRRGARVVLNAAPAQALAAELLDAVDVLVVNEGEARMLAGTDDTGRACRRLAAASRTAVVTRGAAGALYSLDGALHAQHARSIDVVDSVGAGDAFIGSLAAALDRRAPFTDAIREAVAAGSLACMTDGAQPSLPSRDAIARAAAALPPGT